MATPPQARAPTTQLISTQHLQHLRAAAKAAGEAVAYKEGVHTAYEFALAESYRRGLAALVVTLEQEIVTLSLKEMDLGYSSRQRARCRGKKDGLEAVLQLLHGERAALPLF